MYQPIPLSEKTTSMAELACAVRVLAADREDQGRSGLQAKRGIVSAPRHRHSK
jgi:hypothetical protein